MIGIYRQYVNETYDKNGLLKTYSVNVPENFNFAFDIVDEIARLEPGKRALVWCDEHGAERIFTFAEMKEYSDRAANFFRSMGIRKGDRVMLLLKRHYEYWIAVLALHKLGAVAVPGVAMLTEKDLAYRFNAAGIKAVMSTSDGETADQVDLAQAESSTLALKIIARGSREGWLSFHEGLQAASPDFERPRGEEATHVRDMMLMYFTSGTTGFPKMVYHDYSYPIGHIITARHWQNVMPDGLHLSVADTGWAKAGWGKIYGQWIMEAPIFVYDFDRFDANDLLTVIEKYGVTTFCAPPTIYRFLIKEGLGGHDLSCLRYACTAGEALNAEVFKKFYEYTGLRIMEGFGQTESVVLIGNLRGMEPHRLPMSTTDSVCPKPSMMRRPVYS